MTVFTMACDQDDDNVRVRELPEDEKNEKYVKNRKTPPKRFFPFPSAGHGPENRSRPQRFTDWRFGLRLQTECRIVL